MVNVVAVTQGAGELVGKTAQEVVAYVTRVSAPQNQLKFDTAPKLLKYCIENNHWSPFEHGYLTLEIITTRAIAAQILRHRSFTFQEFSQRYAEVQKIQFVEARRQDLKNRQNSLDDLDEKTKGWFKGAQKEIGSMAEMFYKQALEKGIAKECARFLLPLNSETKLYMTGSIRSWVHYIQLRSASGTQKEHMDIALECQKLFCEQFKDIAEALGWVKSTILITSS